jgi:hypothetical protein
MPYDLSVAAPAAVAAIAELSLLSLAGLAMFVGAVSTPWALLAYLATWLPPSWAALRKIRLPTKALRLDALLKP